MKDKHIISSGLEFEVVNTDKHLLYIVNFESNSFSSSKHFGTTLFSITS